ncbi:methyl-accepting chemotaxis protein [Bosea sp. TWI1241]|uniref:methyl-accepting chemotaxis protein n=1 Tax=Bosea sp. TWI1241 TaxID=3148904 RepID=UPI00320B02C2
MKSIRFKILAMLGIVAAGAVICAALSLFALLRTNDLNFRAATQAQLALLTERVNAQVLAVVMDSRGIYMARTPAEVERFGSANEARFPTMRKLAAELVATAPVDQREAAKQLEKSIHDFIGFRTETVRLGRQVSVAAANEQGNNELNRANRETLNKQLVAFSELTDRNADVLAADAATFSKQVMWILPLVLLTMLAGALGAAMVFARSAITKPLGDMTEAMNGIASGKLDTTVPHAERADEIGAMASALRVFQENLVRVRALEQQERTAAEARLRSADAMASVVSDVGVVVAAAAAGDFSARLQIAHGDAQMQQLVDGINEINAVVDSATTEFAQVLQAMAEGDLTHRVDTAYRGRFADLKASINETAGKLSEALRTVQTTVADVGLSAREIATGADDLSKRTEEQASALEQSAATTEELAASVKASAQSSKQGVVLAGEAMSVAQAGGAVVTDAVAAMARIEDASQKISDIIRVIDDIAFQTNLLALNAAVEAARAGDAGKGFAVVASEVRTLAQRSGEAAKDISTLISSSNSEVGEGVRLVRQAGEALTRIVDAARKVQETVAEVAAASAEQANGIDEMSQTVAHMDEMTQQNAALSEQSAASAAALSGKIGELDTLVASFRTAAGPAGGAIMTAAAMPAGPRPAPALVERRAPAARSESAAEPERLRRLAEAAFAQQKAAPQPRRAAGGSRGGDSGWEEF